MPAECAPHRRPAARSYAQGRCQPLSTRLSRCARPSSPTAAGRSHAPPPPPPPQRSVHSTASSSETDDDADPRSLANEKTQCGREYVFRFLAIERSLAVTSPERSGLVGGKRGRLRHYELRARQSPVMLLLVIGVLAILAVALAYRRRPPRDLRGKVVLVCTRPQLHSYCFTWGYTARKKKKTRGPTGQ